jgi:hypothetical protein
VKALVVVSNPLQETDVMNSHIMEEIAEGKNSNITFSVLFFISSVVIISIVGVVFMAVA